MANEKRLIDANGSYTLNDCNETGHSLSFGGGFIDVYDPRGKHICQFWAGDAPTVDAVEVVHGRWEKAHIAGYLKCNCCKDAFIYEEWLENGKWNYCPNCGAKMDGERKDNE